VSSLPRGWTEVEVGDVATLTDGPFGSNLKTSHYVESGRRVVRLQNIGDGYFRDEQAHISDEHFETLRKHEVTPGDVVVASLGDDAPRAALIPPSLGRAIVKADCIRLRPASGVEPGFIMWMLNSPPVRRFAADSIRGVGRPRLGLRGIRALRLPVPPLAEQRRIVAAIEEQFSRLDAAERTLSRALLMSQRFREAALADALRSKWPIRPLGELVVRLRNGTFVSRPAAHPPGIPIFRISAVRPMQLDAADVRYARVDPSALHPFFVEPGDLLFTRYSGNPEYVGACARVRALDQPTLHPDKLIRAVPDQTIIEPAFLELACSSGLTRAEIRGRRKTTAGQVGISGSQLRSVPVPVPPLDEQRRIVAEVEQQLSLIDSLRVAVESAQKRSAALRRAILERAFRGELVPQDPADEPASVLLERLRAERAAAPKPTRRRRATMEAS
jgi:type I restriction enzyme, S subunit